MIPVGTDAPLYHRPVVTLGLIAANIAAFVVAGFPSPSDAGAWQGWILTYGAGVHPEQWLSWNFVHFGFVHLIGNLLFLWTFGMLVEGKIGWWRFLTLYLATGIVGGLIIQLIMLGYRGPVVGAGGASLVLFGLLAISVLWAPENEVTIVCFGWYGRVYIETEVRVFVIALIYLGLQLLGLTVSTIPMGSQAVHLIGMGLGTIVGLGMLRTDRVDCEGWDLLSLWRKGRPQSDLMRSASDDPQRQARSDRQTRRQAVAAPARVPDAELESMLDRAVTAGSAEQAETCYGSFSSASPSPSPQLRASEVAVCRLLMRERPVPVAVAALTLFVQRYSSDADRQRLCLATLLLQELKRPRAAMRVVEPIDSAELGPPQQKVLGQIRKLSAQMIADGVLEVAS